MLAIFFSTCRSQSHTMITNAIWFTLLKFEIWVEGNEMMNNVYEVTADTEVANNQSSDRITEGDASWEITTFSLFQKFLNYITEDTLKTILLLCKSSFRWVNWFSDICNINCRLYVIQDRTTAIFDKGSWSFW
jgi:hypothetical protein